MCFVNASLRKSAQTLAGQNKVEDVGCPSMRAILLKRAIASFRPCPCLQLTEVLVYRDFRLDAHALDLLLVKRTKVRLPLLESTWKDVEYMEVAV